MLAGAEKLKEKILAEAEFAAGRSINQAREEAEKVLAAAQKEADDKSFIIIEKATKEAAERKNRIIAAAELEARKMRLQAKQELIQEAYDKALGKLNDLPWQQYIEVLCNLVNELAVKGKYELLLSGSDKAEIGEELVLKVNSELKNKGRSAVVNLSNQNAPIKKGFILRQDNTEINSSFKAVINSQRDELEAEVVKALF